MKIRFVYTFMIAVLVLSTTGTAQQKSSVEVGNVDPGQMQYQAFTLNSDADVEITGEAATFRDRHDSWFFNDNSGQGWTNNLMFYGWLLNSKTRKVVWHSLEKYSDIRTSRNTEFVPINSSINLPKGSYELYFASAKSSYNFNSDNNGDFIDWIKDFFGFGENEFRDKYKDELSIKVSGPTGIFNAADAEQLRKNYLAGSIVSLEEARDNESMSKGFTLAANTKLKIYSIGEAREKETFDYAWIYDNVNNKIAWRMNWDNTDYAGGAEKNIVFDDEISLPAGTYTVHYVTDDSHSFQRWNSFPPDDPQFWGVAVFPATKSDMAKVVPFREQDVVQPIVDLTKIGDDKMVSQGLRVKEPLDVRILCLGESTNRQDYVDYGWIINADTRETVWTMNGKYGENAGGAEKNRMIDETIKLQPGHYLVYYATDGSHSYEDWNAAAPYDPTKWGITIWPLDNKSRSKTELFSAANYKNKNEIVEIVRVGDNERLQRTFDLNNETKIKVYALGEGFSGGMADYGWIENAVTGKVVWDMSYRRTDYAGGANKNRMINETITLPAGKYYVYYRTDGSHSYRDWNDDPPSDQDDYGITLSYAK